MQLDHPQHPLWKGVAIVLTIAAVSCVVYGRVRTPPSQADKQSIYIVPSESPCSAERHALACERMIAKGWGCVHGPGGTPVIAMEFDGKKGGHGQLWYRAVIGVDKDACGRDDPTIEHEYRHEYGDEDCPSCPTGYIMSTPSNRTGFHIPTYKPGAEK